MAYTKDDVRKLENQSRGLKFSENRENKGKKGLVFLDEKDPSSAQHQGTS